jgi:Zn-dependent protease with chaperone function
VSTSFKANFYDGLTSKPKEALVGLREPGSLEVEVDGERFFWPLEHGGMEWERSSSMLRITFGEHPRRVLIVREPLFIKSFVTRMQYAGRRGVYDRTLSLARKGPLLFFLGLVAVLVGGYFWMLPFAAERMALLLPLEVDKQLGKASYGSIMLGLPEDTARSAVLQRFGDKLELSEKFDLRFHLVESEQVNASAMPGGDIVVFSGIVDGMERPEQLAALLAHEATHVDERHSTRMMVRQMAGYLFLSLLLGDVNAVVALVAENADNLRNLSYSRGLETDADAHGMERMQAAGVDPQGMVQLLELLEKQSADMPEEMAFLSSHPLTTHRIEQARSKASGTERITTVDPELQRLFQELKAPRPEVNP